MKQNASMSEPKKSKKNRTKTKIKSEDLVESIADKKQPLISEAEKDETKKARKLKPREKEHYVNGKEFEEEIKLFYKTGFVSNELGESINKIANGLSYASNFINYSYKEDMVGDAVVKMFSALKNRKFNTNSGFSPFSYFTTIAFHAFINRIKKEKKHHKTITEYREKVYSDLMINPEENGGVHIYVDMTNNDDLE